LLTVLLPEYVPVHWWEQLLHNQWELGLRAAFLWRPEIAVASVPVVLHERAWEASRSAARRLDLFLLLFRQLALLLQIPGQVPERPDFTAHDVTLPTSIRHKRIILRLVSPSQD